MLKPLAIVLGCLLIGGIAFAAQREFGSENRNNLALVNDLDIASKSNRTRDGGAALPSGRFTIVHMDGHTILLDTKKGNTWHLVQGERLEWIEIPRKTVSETPADDTAPIPEEDPFK